VGAKISLSGGNDRPAMPLSEIDIAERLGAHGDVLRAVKNYPKTSALVESFTQGGIGSRKPDILDKLDRFEDTFDIDDLLAVGDDLEELFSAENKINEIYKEEHGERYEPFSPWIAIDLYASDKDLKLCFMEWVRSARKKADIQGTKTFTQRDKDKWTSNQVLPYIDLMLIQKATGSTLTAYRIAGLLLPNHSSDATGKVNKSSRPEALRMLEPESLATLSAAAASEMLKNGKVFT
jgi:hypothetical protein